MHLLIYMQCHFTKDASRQFILLFLTSMKCFEVLECFTSTCSLADLLECSIICMRITGIGCVLCKEMSSGRVSTVKIVLKNSGLK